MTTPMNSVVSEVCRSVGNEPARLMDVACAIQSRLGCVSPEAMDEIHRALGVPRLTVQSLVSFYSFLSEVPKGKIVIRLCDDVVDRLSGTASPGRSRRSSASGWARRRPTLRSRWSERPASA